MKKYNIAATVSMLFALYLYMVYRTSQTVVNAIAGRLFSKEIYFSLKNTLAASLPLPGFFIYSLPEALWVFAATLLAFDTYISIGKLRVPCFILPLLVSYMWEIFQLVGITNGRFDTVDIVSCTFAFFIAYAFKGSSQSLETAFRPFTFKGILVMAMFAVIYLSHVIC